MAQHTPGGLRVHLPESSADLASGASGRRRSLAMKRKESDPATCMPGCGTALRSDAFGSTSVAVVRCCAQHISEHIARCTHPTVVVASSDVNADSLEKPAHVEVLIEPYTRRELALAVKVVACAGISLEHRLAHFKFVQDLITNGVYDGLYVLDREWRYSYIDSNSERALGRSKDAFLGKCIWELFPTLVHTEMGELLRRASDTRTITTPRVEWWPPLHGWFESKYVPWLDGSLLILWSNVTAQRSRAAIAALLAKLRATLSIAFTTTEQFFAYAAVSVVGHFIWTTVDVCAPSTNGFPVLCRVAAAGATDQHVAVLRDLPTVAQSQIAPDAELGICTDDDPYTQFSRKAWPGSSVLICALRVQQRLLGYWTFGLAEGVFDPVLQAGLLDAAREVSLSYHNYTLYAEAKAASLAKTQFIGTLSHELRTPLTPAFLLLDALASEPCPTHEQVAREVSVIRSNLELERQLIDDLLDMTRIENGKLAFNMAPLDLHEVLRNCAALVEPHASEQNLAIRLHLGATSHTVLGDSVRLQQVFWNLLKNAIKFSQRGQQITVTTENHTHGSIAVSVRDHGMGIPPAALKRIFVAFEQADNAVAKRAGGLGLGLSIAKNLIDRHSGSIEASSEGEGRGATFTVRLPCSDTPIERLEVGPTEARRKSMGRVCRILVVEDNEASLAVLTRLLATRLRHDVTAARSAEEAEAILDASPPFDLLISDIGLPDKNGHELLRSVRKRRPQQRAIALSGLGSEDDVRASADAGYLRHVTKPVSFSALRVAIEEALADGEGGGGGTEAALTRLSQHF